MLTVEERKEKFNKLIEIVAEAKKIMAELNKETDNAETVLAVTIDKWDIQKIHIAGYGEQEIVDVVKLDKVAEHSEEANEFYTVINGVKVFMLKWGNE